MSLRVTLVFAVGVGLLSGCASGVALINPESSETAQCPVARLFDDVMAVARQLPAPKDFALFGRLQAQYDSGRGRITFVEYCARRYELAGFVRSTGTSVSRTVEYSNPTYRWSITYPGAWRLDDSNRRSVKIIRDTEQAVLGIHVADAAGKSLDGIADTILRTYPPQQYTIISRRKITLRNDLAAIEVVHHIGSGLVGKSQKVITTVKGRAFLIDAETFLLSWPTFERDFASIIGSFTTQD